MSDTDWVAREFGGSGLKLPTDEERDRADALMARWAAQWGEEYQPIPRSRPGDYGGLEPTNRAYLRSKLRRWWRKPLLSETKSQEGK